MNGTIDSVFFVVAHLAIVRVLYWAVAEEHRRRAQGEPWPWWWLRGVPALSLIGLVVIGVGAWRLSGGHWVRPAPTLAEVRAWLTYDALVSLLVLVLGLAWLCRRHAWIEDEMTRTGRVPWWSVVLVYIVVVVSIGGLGLWWWSANVPGHARGRSSVSLRQACMNRVDLSCVAIATGPPDVKACLGCQKCGEVVPTVTELHMKRTVVDVMALHGFEPAVNPMGPART